jgi:hypothetical protein
MGDLGGGKAATRIAEIACRGQIRPFQPNEKEEGKWRLLLPGASEPRLPLLRRQDFKSVFKPRYAA